MITVGATWYSGCPGAHGNLCDGGLYFAELGTAGANAAMGGLLGKALGRGGELPAGTKLRITFRGKTVIASKRDRGSGQRGDRHYKIDLHSRCAAALGFIPAGKANVQVGLASDPGSGANAATTGTSGGGSEEITRERPYEFSRGTADKKESSWDCMGRLADEVQWRRFMSNGGLWFASEDWMTKQRVAYRVSEVTRGVVDLSFEFETRKEAAQATLRVQARRYSISPGMVVELVDEGPADGIWLVSNVRRGLSSQIAEVTLIRKRPKLPEPAPETETITVANNNVSTGGANVRGGGPSGSAAAVYAAAQEATRQGWRYSQPMRNQQRQGGYADCSSGVSWVLQKAGVPLPGPFRPNAPVSGAYTRWGNPGYGQRVTIMAHGGHVWIMFHNFPMKVFDTGGGSGGKLQPAVRNAPGPYVKRHWGGM